MIRAILTVNSWPKIITNIIFLACASFLNIAVLVEIPGSNVGKVFFVIMGIGLEISAAYTLALSFLPGRKKLLIAYAFQVSLALCLAVFYGVSQINTIERVSQTGALQQKERMKIVTENNRLISSLQSAVEKETNTGMGWRMETAIKRIDKLKTENLSLLSQTDTNRQIAAGMFSKYGPVGETIKFIIFILMSLLIQWALYLTKWTIPAPVEVKTTPERPASTFKEFILKHRESIFRYLDGLTRGDSGVCNGDPTVSKLTGIPLEHCIKYKDILSAVKLNGTPLINKRQGGTRVNFPIEQIKTELLKVH